MPSKEITIPAPVGGLNSRDAVANMKQEYGIRMKNMFPTTRGVRVRKGILDHVTGIGSEVESLMPYSMPNGTETLFCAAGTAFYDVTTAGAVGAAVVSSLTNARWESVNFTNSSGTSYLCCFNGVNSPEYWDNSSWTAITGASSPAITGVTPSNLFGPAIHKRRLWTIQVNTLKAWYLPVDAVGGAAKALDLSGMCRNGGYLQAIGSYTIDGGNGPDDYWVGITSKGEVVIYAGTDPSSASTWSLVGVYQIGAPLGRRCLLKFGSDLLVLTRNGIEPIPKILSENKDNRTVTLTDLIREEIAELTHGYGDSFGWQMEYFSEANILLLGTPKIAESLYINLPGSSGDYVSSPDSSSFDITGDIDIRIHLKPDAWGTGSKYTLVSKWTSTGNQRSYSVSINATRNIVLETSPDGTSGSAVTFTSTDVASSQDNDKKWLRITLDVDNGASGKTANFYESFDGITWVDIGTAVTSAGTTSIYSSTAVVEIGSQDAGTSNLYTGRVYNVQIYDSTTLVGAIYNKDIIYGDTTILSNTGETWTLNGNTAVAAGTYNQKQYPMNTLTNRWGGEWDCSANCFAVFNKKLYYGGNGKVVNIWKGDSDNGTTISFDMIQAFNYFKRPGTIKQWHMAKPIIITDAPLTTVTMDLLVDFEDVDETATIAIEFKNDPVYWDIALWRGEQTTTSWQSVNGVGDCAALRLKGTINGNPLEFIAVSYLYELGGVVG